MVYVKKQTKRTNLVVQAGTKFYLYSDKSENVTMELVMFLKGDD